MRKEVLHMDRSIGEYARKYGFRVLDFIQGRAVMKQYEEIKYLLYHPKDAIRNQRKRFEKLASFAVKNTEFYKDVKFTGKPKLADFPIIDKNDIKGNYGAMCSEFASRKDAVRMHTSGSTGTPLVIIQDHNKRNRVYAEMLFLWGISGYEVGMRYMFLRKWNNINKKNLLTSFARNLLMTDVTTLDDDTLERIRKKLVSDHKIRMIIGYASTLDALAEYLDRKHCEPEDFNVRSILSGSEVLTEKTRKILKKVFGCNVVSLYSNQENGMLAIECNSNKEFHLNTASYIFEILKMDSDEPADYGEAGRVIVTDLYNYAMPIIRYDTGDVAIKKRDVECDIPTEVLTSIEGRKVDIVYTTNGVPLSPHTITNELWKFRELKQFQLIQKSKKRYEFVVNDPQSRYSDQELQQTCRDFFGRDAEVTVRRVNSIPVLASGKFQYIVCAWDGKENG